LRISRKNNLSREEYAFNENNTVTDTTGTTTYTFDANGNQLTIEEPSGDITTNTWNGENRLICAEEQVCPTNRTLRKVEYAYDHQGRMVWKEIKHRDAEAQSWQEEKTITCLWDNFNIIAETVAQDTATNTTFNIWGLDLDGTLQGAGGVGGLLAVVKDSATYIPAWDANGNIMEYVSVNGTIAAHREYDPFGGTVVATGEANAFTHWFSTKPWCPITGHSEYQYRKYSPVLGRWLSRDLWTWLSEPNLYSIALNSPLVNFDVRGAVTYIKLKAKDIVVQDGNPGTDNLATYTFPSMLDCSCTNCYSIRCTLTEYSATIIVNYTEAKKVEGGVDGRVGHEQVHLLNTMKFNQAIVTAVAPWEAVIFKTEQECNDKANAIVGKYGELKGKFNDKEIAHENFKFPEANKGSRRVSNEDLLEKGPALNNPQINYIPPDYKVDFERL